MQRYEHLKGSDEVRGALVELVRVGHRSIVAYRAAERMTTDHRVQTALAQLRRDHRRHVHELREILAVVGAKVVAPDGGEAPEVVAEVRGVRDPVAEVGVRDDVSITEAVESLMRAEAELRDTYARHVGRSYPEPLRSALTRHMLEEEAHLRWLQESRWWRMSAS